MANEIVELEVERSVKHVGNPAQVGTGDQIKSAIGKQCTSTN